MYRRLVRLLYKYSQYLENKYSFVYLNQTLNRTRRANEACLKANVSLLLSCKMFLRMNEHFNLSLVSSKRPNTKFNGRAGQKLATCFDTTWEFYSRRTGDYFWHILSSSCIWRSNDTKRKALNVITVFSMKLESYFCMPMNLNLWWDVGKTNVF